MAESSAAEKKRKAGNYFANSYQELRKVTWPTRARSIKLTFLVIGFCVVIAAFVGVLDYVFGFGNRALLDLGPTGTLPPAIGTEGVDVTVGEEAPSATAVDVGEVVVGDSADGVGVEVETEPAEESAAEESNP